MQSEKLLEIAQRIRTMREILEIPVAEMAQQTIAACGGSASFASTRALALATVNLADEYIKAKTAAEAAEAKCRALEAENAALRQQVNRNSANHPGNRRR